MLCTFVLPRQQERKDIQILWNVHSDRCKKLGEAVSCEKEFIKGRKASNHGGLNRYLGTSLLYKRKVVFV